MDSKELFDGEENMEIASWILEYLVYTEKFNEYYCIVEYLFCRFCKRK